MTIRLSVHTCTVLAFTLIAGAAFPSSEASAHLGPGAGCPKLGPTADQYVDRAKLCRDARHELLRSLKTGKPADWIKVYRGALREPDRPARKAAAKHHHTTSHHTKARHSKPEHHLRSGIQHAAPPARRIQHPAPTLVTTTPPPKSPPPVPASKAPVVTTSATPPSTRTSALPASVGRHQPMASVPPGETSRSDAWDLWSVVVSLVLVA
ncbi:MAG: hypothetical protein JWL97_3675, partial [Gemmatimonadales bacterium]|nr:hypothetical protein [Gemmatimonadales bacterium]